MPPHGKRCCGATEHHEGQGDAGKQEALLSKLSDQPWPSPQEVLEQYLLLDQGEKWQQDMEELMAMANDIKATRREPLRDGTREEKGWQQEEHHLVDTFPQTSVKK